MPFDRCCSRDPRASMGDEHWSDLARLPRRGPRPASAATFDNDLASPGGTFDCATLESTTDSSGSSSDLPPASYTAAGPVWTAYDSLRAGRGPRGADRAGRSRARALSEDAFEDRPSLDYTAQVELAYKRVVVSEATTPNHNPVLESRSPSTASMIPEDTVAAGRRRTRNTSSASSHSREALIEAVLRVPQLEDGETETRDRGALRGLVHDVAAPMLEYDHPVPVHRGRLVVARRTPARAAPGTAVVTRPTRVEWPGMVAAIESSY